MSFPKFRNKHLEEGIFGPKDSLKFDKRKKLNLPKKYIIVYDRHLINRLKRKYKLKKHKVHFFGSELYLHKGVGIIKMEGIGAPHAVSVFENFISLGANVFLNIGFAGGLQKEGIFLCKKALRDEGVSHHYISHGDYSYPDEKLTKKFGKILKKRNINFEEGITWTIDAPYRETKSEVEHYSKKGISTVEMEASALFAVAKVKKVKIASGFVVSDVLGNKWEYKYHKLDVKKALDDLFDSAMECLR